MLWLAPSVVALSLHRLLLLLGDADFRGSNLAYLLRLPDAGGLLLLLGHEHRRVTIKVGGFFLRLLRGLHFLTLLLLQRALLPLLRLLFDRILVLLVHGSAGTVHGSGLGLAGGLSLGGLVAR